MPRVDATIYRRDDIKGIDPPALLLFDSDDADAWILSTAYIRFPFNSETNQQNYP